MKSESVSKFVEWLNVVTTNVFNVNVDDRRLFAVAAEEKWGEIPPHIKWTYALYKKRGIVPQFVADYILSIAVVKK